MKATGEAVGGPLKALLLACVLVLSTTLSLAQDVTITNLDQLARVALSADYSIYLPFSPWDWRAYPTDWPLWCDFTDMACLGSLPTATNFMTSVEWSNVPLASVILTKDVLSGVTIVESANSTDVLAAIAAPSDYQPSAASADRWLWDWYVQATNDPDSWGLTPGQIPPPTITLRTFLVDSNAYYSVYASNLEVESAAAASLTTASRGGMAMEDEYDLSGGPCPITSDASAFYVMGEARASNAWVTTTWQSCTDHVYIVQAESSLTPTSSWVDVAWMFGANQSTSWSDTNAPSFSKRFYRVVRGNPNTLNGGIPYGWAVSYGLDPLSPSVATGDSDGDGYSNWDEYLMGTNPTNANDMVTVYVDSLNTNGVYDGSPANPFRSIQDAIESSVPLTSNLAIRVRPGKYYEPVSNLQYNPYYGNVLSSRQYLYIYGANEDWSLSTDPESHVIDTLGSQHRDLLLFSNAPSAPVVEFNGVARARINGFTLRGGRGPSAGGILALSTNNGPIYISNCIIEKNGGVNSYAGGIYIQAATNSLIYNTVVAKNTGTISGAFDVNGSRIWNCTIISNQNLDATLGVVTADFSPSNVRNCIAWNGGIDLYFANVDYSTFGSNEFSTTGAHNLSADPILVSVPFGNYRLQTNTTVRGASTSLPLEPHDLYGNPRPATGSFDIGANQYTDTLGSGMQNDWEIKHGLSVTVNQASLDPDGDGLNNLQEYNQNTDPHNPDTDSDGISDGPLVPAGSGLQPGPDPDPSTPDVVLNTVFWDYYFEKLFLLYVDGAPDPRWVNDPPTSPRQVVLDNYHVGDHVNLQWQFLYGSGYDDPYLVFYVPTTSLGSIIPDVDAVPLNQVQFGFGDMAPPDGPWGFTIAEAYPTSPNFCAGFDDESMRFPSAYGLSMPALSVPQSGTNTFTVEIDPPSVVSQISFQTVDTNLASVTPSTASSALQDVDVLGRATGNTITNTQFTALGIGAQNSFTTVCSQVAIDILPKAANVTVAIWAVTAKGEPSTTPTNLPTQASLSNYLNQVYGEQANVFFSVMPLVSTNINYDFSPTNGVLDVETQDATKQSDEQKAITNAAFRDRAFNIYYVGRISYALGISYPTLSNAYIQDSHAGLSTVNITAHEIGHLLGLDDVGAEGQPPGNADRLMGGAIGDPCRLIRSEWRTANEKARGATQ